MNREEDMYEYWFANIRGISVNKKIKLRETVTSAKELYIIEEKRLPAWVSEKDRECFKESLKSWKLTEEYEKLEKNAIQFLPYFSEGYPEALLRLYDMPYAVYIKGKPYQKECPTVAIVGARACSPYGELMAIRFAEALSEASVRIISGLARGVDSAAQRGALNVGGVSYGVLGCGADICYPRENIGLYTDLQEKGGILSEYAPGVSPLPHHFPMRNRIISALSDVVLVMEARKKSGSLITADQALELGKDVYALPGPVNSELSEGCNRLIKQGAGVLMSAEELLSELSLLSGRQKEKEVKKEIKLESTENLLYSCLGLYPKSVNELVRETCLPVQTVTSLLVSLELEGYIREISKNYYVKIERTV